MLDWDLSEFPNLKKWLDKVMQYEEMQKAHEGLFRIIKEMKENKRMFPKL